MIAFSKPAARIKTDFIVSDIENRMGSNLNDTNSGTLLAICTYDGESYTMHENWFAWFEWVKLKARNEKRYRTIYAHNGSGWDWLSFISHILKKDHNQTFSTIENSNRIILVSLQTDDGVTIKLVDSVYLLASSLDDAATKYTGKGKVKLDHKPEWYYDNDRPKFWEYIQGDTATLYTTLLAFANLVYSRIAPIPKLGVTLPSTSLRCFQTSYLSKEITTPGSDRIKRLARQGYSGGRVEVFHPGYYPQIHVYDINSLYPSVMATTPVPNTGNARFTKKLDLDSCGIYTIRFNQPDRSRYPLLMVDGFGAYSGTGTYYVPEIRRLAEMGGKIEVIEGCIFQSSAIIFKDYVEKLYKLRMEDKDGPLGNTCKLLMNSLYGKFAIRPERKTTRRLSATDALELIRSGEKVECLNPADGVYRITEETEITYEHCAIAGTITSESRARLWESFNSGTVYCDTDSIHTLREFDGERIGPGLGQWKQEYKGEGIYVGKKLYALRSSAGTEKIRAKGIRVKRKPDDELGFDLTFDGLKTLLDGNKIKCTFRGAVTANQTLKGQNPCQFREKTRVIRQTAKPNPLLPILPMV